MSSGSEEEKDEVGKLGALPPAPPKPQPSGKAGASLRSYDPIPIIPEYFDRQLEMGNFPIYCAGDQGVLFFCVHGAGHSGASFAHIAQVIKQQGHSLAAFDLRAHGMNKIPPQQQDEMSIANLVSDTTSVLEHILTNIYPGNSVIIVGHSLGGSIASRVAATQTNPRIKGLIQIDVVEGSALDALPFMESVVLNRPQEFQDFQQAVQWAVRSSTIKNMVSARLSIPTQIVQKQNGKYMWRNDMMKGQPFWREWFTGLNAVFLGVALPKILVLAGNDRMDREMTIAQMQGKFKLVIVAKVGHVVHEDDPKELASQFLGFLKAFKIQ